MNKKSSIISVSAQFGGPDATEVALPHFKALQFAMEGLLFEGFPFSELAFILRVDGEFQKFGFSGPLHLATNKRADYLSIDFGLTIEDRTRIFDVILSAILHSADFIKSSNKKFLLDVDFQSLNSCLGKLADRYKYEFFK